MDDEKIDAIWESLDGKAIVQDENQINWNRALRRHFARAILATRQSAPTEQQLQIMRQSAFDAGKAYGELGQSASIAAAAPQGDIEDPVIVPRGLLGAACHAIVNKKDAPNTLEKLRAIILAKPPADAAPVDAKSLLMTKLHYAFISRHPDGMGFTGFDGALIEWGKRNCPEMFVPSPARVDAEPAEAASDDIDLYKKITAVIFERYKRIKGAHCASIAYGIVDLIKSLQIAAQPAPAQGDALSQQAAGVTDIGTVASEAYQQGRAAGIEEAVYSLEDLCYGAENGGGGTVAERLRQAQRIIRALNK